MEIKASGKFDLKSIKALIRLMLYKKANPKRRMILWTSIYAVLLIIILAELFLWGFDKTLFVLLITNLVISGLGCYQYFILPKKQYNALGKLKDIENEFLFLEDSVQITAQSEEYSGETEIKYSLIFKVFETSKYFFIFQNKTQVYIVDKSTMSANDSQEVRRKLMDTVDGKYILCKY